MKFSNLTSDEYYALPSADMSLDELKSYITNGGVIHVFTTNDTFGRVTAMVTDNGQTLPITAFAIIKSMAVETVHMDNEETDAYYITWSIETEDTPEETGTYFNIDDRFGDYEPVTVADYAELYTLSGATTTPEFIEDGDGIYEYDSDDGDYRMIAEYVEQ